MSKKQKQQTINTAPWQPAQNDMMAALGMSANWANQGLSPSLQAGLADTQALDMGRDTMMSTMRGDMIGQNPYLDQIAQRAGSNVNSMFSGAGRTGSGLHAQGLAEAMAPIYAQDYTRERQNQLAAAQMAPSVYNLGLLPGQTEREMMYQPIQQYASIASQMGHGGGNQSQPMHSSTGGSILGGAMTGLGIGKALAPVGAAVNPWWGVGGGLLGLL